MAKFAEEKITRDYKEQEHAHRKGQFSSLTQKKSTGIERKGHLKQFLAQDRFTV